MSNNHRRTKTSTFHYFLFQLVILEILQPTRDTTASAATAITSARGAIPQMELLNNIKTIKVNLLKELTAASTEKMIARIPSSFYYHKGRREDGKFTFRLVYAMEGIMKQELFMWQKNLILK